ncbi:MAG: helix-turn-helix domain-containing protein [Desulfobacter sp.]|nr:MAG: helix-turn-helix domain-containing protein [Desulfobacter sp.]
MMDDIPQVAFHKPKKDRFEFEVLPFEHFFSRKIKPDFPVDRPHRLEFYQLLYITKGEGRHYIDFKPYEFSPGSLLFVSPGQVHAFEVNLEAAGFLILFTEDFLAKNMIHSDILPFSRLFNYHLYPPVIPPRDTPDSVFGPIINEIHNEYMLAESFAKEEMLRTLLKLLLLKAERIKRELAPGEKNSEWVARFGEFKSLLADKFAETRNAQAYADMMNISYNHLNKIAKAVTGSTAKSFIDGFIILEIKRQLAVSDISVKELAYLMGFDEPTNFVKYFRKHTRKSPAQFRRVLMQSPAF